MKFSVWLLMDSTPYFIDFMNGLSMYSTTPPGAQPLIAPLLTQEEMAALMHDVWPAGEGVFNSSHPHVAQTVEDRHSALSIRTVRPAVSLSVPDIL
jgi:hypothetical protein